MQLLLGVVDMQLLPYVSIRQHVATAGAVAATAGAIAAGVYAAATRHVCRAAVAAGVYAAATKHICRVAVAAAPAPHHCAVD